MNSVYSKTLWTEKYFGRNSLLNNSHRLLFPDGDDLWTCYFKVSIQEKKRNQKRYLHSFSLNWVGSDHPWGFQCLDDTVIRCLTRVRLSNWRWIRISRPNDYNWLYGSFLVVCLIRRKVWATIKVQSSINSSMIPCPSFLRLQLWWENHILVRDSGCTWWRYQTLSSLMRSFPNLFTQRMNGGSSKVFEPNIESLVTYPTLGGGLREKRKRCIR